MKDGEQIDSSLAMARVLPKPEIQAFLRQADEWLATVGERYSLDFQLPTERRGLEEAIPGHMRGFWARLEGAARSQILEVEEMRRRYRSGRGSLTADTICGLYGKALELQVKHTIIRGLSDFLVEEVSSLGQQGQAVVRLAKLGHSGVRQSGVNEYLAQRRMNRKQFEDFGWNLIRTAGRYRNPGLHDTAKLVARDVEEARRTVLGDGEGRGLLYESVRIHWGSQFDEQAN
jgi:hypothetical protein